MIPADENLAIKPPPKIRKLLLKGAFLLPLLLTLGIAALFLFRLAGEPSPGVLPSQLLGEKSPRSTLPPLPGSTKPAPQSAQFQAQKPGHIVLVNFFASWCPPCIAEMPSLHALAADPRITVIGIALRDAPADTLEFLARTGDPYHAIGMDADGRAAVDWGLSGLPETFALDHQGLVIAHHRVPIFEAEKKQLLKELFK